jgi:hypothetical protein
LRNGELYYVYLDFSPSIIRMIINEVEMGRFCSAHEREET